MKLNLKNTKDFKIIVTTKGSSKLSVSQPNPAGKVYGSCLSLWSGMSSLMGSFVVITSSSFGTGWVAQNSYVFFAASSAVLGVDAPSYANKENTFNIWLLTSLNESTQVACQFLTPYSFMISFPLCHIRCNHFDCEDEGYEVYMVLHIMTNA